MVALFPDPCTRAAYRLKLFSEVKYVSPLFDSKPSEIPMPRTSATVHIIHRTRQSRYSLLLRCLHLHTAITTDFTVLAGSVLLMCDFTVYAHPLLMFKRFYFVLFCSKYVSALKFRCFCQTEWARRAGILQAAINFRQHNSNLTEC